MTLLSRTIHGTSCCCEIHSNTKDLTENLFTRVSSSRAQAGHTHTRVPSLVYQASSSVCAVCLLLLLSTQLLTYPLSAVTTKPSELFLKDWTKRSDLHYFFVVVFCFRTPAVHSPIVWFTLCTNMTSAIQKSAFTIRFRKTPSPQSSFKSCLNMMHHQYNYSNRKFIMNSWIKCFHQVVHVVMQRRAFLMVMF